MSEPTSHTLTNELRPVLDQLAVVMDASMSTDPDAPTPCREYRLADLRQHILGWLTAFADGYADPDGKASDATAVVVTDEPGAQLRGAAARLLTALAEGAAERPLSIGGAAMPGLMALQMILGEYQVHGWDLAVATGQAWTPGQQGVEASLDFFDMMLTPDFQGEGKSFAPRVDQPVDASALDRLLAMTGRDPHWHAS